MPDNIRNCRVLLIGAGYMAREYAKVLSALEVDYEVIGRGEENCRSLNALFPSIKVTSGGLENIEIPENFTHAIVATSVGSLYGNSKNLLKVGIKKILLEKPGGSSGGEVSKLGRLAKEKKATVLLAYNRRFYSSVRKAKECIEEDGGVLSYAFEFTEWPHTIEALDIPSKVKQHWFLANSTHVVDTAFYLAGKPRKMKANTSGSLDWHSTAAIFAGTGITHEGALFTYQANWKSPGRWGIEILTAERRLILRPMETLQVQHHKSVSISNIEIDDKIDKDFKPGLFLQTKSFLTGDWDMFCTIADQVDMVENYYNEMAGY